MGVRSDSTRHEHFMDADGPPGASELHRKSISLLASCALLAAALPGIAAGQTFTFTAPVEHEVPAQARALAVGDISGDGRDDLVVFVGNTNSIEPSHLFVYVQRTDGSLALPYQIQLDAGASNSPSLGIGDFDSDGMNDIVVGLGPSLIVLLADGEGGFSLDLYIDDHSSTVEQIADITGDGHLDILSRGNDATVIVGDGEGFFQSRIVVPSSGQKRLAYGDVTGDGHGDIVGIAQFTLSVSPGDGHGNFAPAITYDTPTAISNDSLAIGNFTGDGRNEVAIGTHTSYGEPLVTLIYGQDQDGNLQPPTVLEGKPLGPSGMPNGLPVVSRARDLNGDGLEDLLIAYNGAVGFYLQGPNGLPNQPTRFDVNFQWAQYGFAIGDLNDDGCPDAAFADEGNALASVMYGVCGTQPNDYNGDGIADLLWHNRATGAGTIWKSANYGTQQGLTRVTNTDWRIAATGDFDGNGEWDIVWRNQNTGAGTIWKSGNSATQQGLTRITDPAWQIVSAGDYDGDGNSDLLWRHASSGKNAIWKSGNFATQQSIAAVTDVRWQAVGSGDFDRDGKDDIVWRHATSGSNAIWRSGNYRTLLPMTAVTNVEWKVGAVGDFDGDGHDDLFWRHTTGNNTIWRSAAYAQQVAVPKQPARWTLAAAADSDGDGRDDLMWRNTVDGSNVIWRSPDASVIRTLTTVPDQNWRVHR